MGIWATYSMLPMGVFRICSNTNLYIRVSFDNGVLLCMSELWFIQLSSWWSTYITWCLDSSWINIVFIKARSWFSNSFLKKDRKTPPTPWNHTVLMWFTHRIPLQAPEHSTIFHIGIHKYHALFNIRVAFVVAHNYLKFSFDQRSIKNCQF